MNKDNEEKKKKNIFKKAFDSVSEKKNKLAKKAAEEKAAAEDKKDALLDRAADSIENAPETMLDKAVDEKFNKRKTTIRMRIIRLGVISVSVCAFIFAGTSMVVFHNNIISNSETKMSDVATAYQSAMDNADILKNNKFVDNIFKNYVENDKDGSFGFILNSSYVVFSETGKEIVRKSMNLKDMAGSDSGYEELYKLANKNFEDKVKEGNDIVRLDGEKYMVSFVKSGTYDGFYIYIMTPYKNIIHSFTVLAVVCVILFIALIATAAIVCTKVSSKISRPITDACKRLKLLSEGDVTSPAPSTDRNDETMVLMVSLEETINSLHTYIEDIDDVLSGIASGDLLVTSKTKYAGDFHDIKRCLEKILLSLNHTFSMVDSSASRVKEYSLQVSDGASTLSGNASTDAATIEELTSSMSEIAVKVENNAEQAKHARELTGHASKQVTVSSEAMSEMVVSIEEMQRSSTEIAKIIKVIDDIAFQTNILALNAAVEASKAGAAGKGFAVVADEVRNLANKSATAASQTGKLIKKSISSMDKSAELAARASEALDDVVVNVKNIDELVGNIATSAIDQANDIEAVNNGMEQINSSIQTTSSTAEESAAASQELTGQSDDLNITIHKFKFRKMEA